MKKKKFKLQRQVGTSLPGLGDKKEKGPMAKRPFPPGQHGRSRGRHISEYGIRLKEKQKVRYHYGLKDKQLRTLVIKSKQKESNWLNAFVDTVERRLDNIVFRLGFFPSIPAARQAVVHGNVLVNGKVLDIPSYICSLEDEISLKEKLYDNVIVIKTLEAPTLDCPHFLSLDKKSKKPVGKVIDTPLLADVPFEFNEQYFIEFCGNIG
ncbi:MAG: 30S ribosomal protein S4 [Rickettsiales bacterium]|nr:30S ribosomal protein S4 [Rickettsiales bacterium]|tara:strand:- start:391 stop:1014 length:624 start_codon:yes stop_codon:yes gene_type:complete